MGNQVTATDRGAAVAVSVRGVSRVFDGGVAALHNVDLEIPPGQFVAILGPSGCGKSTLLRLVAGLDRPQAGLVDVGAARELVCITCGYDLRGNPAGRACPECGASRTVEAAGTEGPGPAPGRRPRIRDDIAYVFQDAHLLPWRNVLRNVALPLELKGIARATRLEAARNVIAQVGLTDAMMRYPMQLSGGMRMRVSLARALITQPRILLLDEPFAALDELTRQRLDEQLYELWQQRQMTVLFVTHSLSEAAFLAQRAVVFSRRPARVVADIPVDLPAQRSAELRTNVHFNELVRQLHGVLEREGA